MQTEGAMVMEVTHDERTEPIEVEANAEVALAHGRSLSIVPNVEADTVEIRAPDGRLEVRIRLTPEGPVLSLESVRLALTARADVEVSCARFAVAASESVHLDSRGELAVTAADDVHVRAGNAARIDGAYVLLACDEGFVPAAESDEAASDAGDGGHADPA